MRIMKRTLSSFTLALLLSATAAVIVAQQGKSPGAKPAAQKGKAKPAAGKAKTPAKTAAKPAATPADEDALKAELDEV